MSITAYFASLSLLKLVKNLPGGVAQGLIWGLMALGVYITFRLLDVADLTVDGSFTTGGAVTVMLILAGVPAWAALLVAVIAGMLAGLCTGLLHTKLGIPAILAGILTQFSLYSINLRIMGMAAKKILGKELQNILLCPEDFDTVEEELRPLKFETIYLNFSDPWPKKRHEKRRLTFLPRLQKIGDLLQEGGMLRIKTDNDNLYAFTLEQIQGLKGLTMVMNEEDYRFDEEGDSMSEYERNFRSIGHKIHRIILKKE